MYAGTYNTLIIGINGEYTRRNRTRVTLVTRRLFSGCDNNIIRVSLPLTGRVPLAPETTYPYNNNNNNITASWPP